MQIANYNNAQTSAGGVGKYPLSTQALDFIQQQILLLQQLSLISGDNYILRAPTDGKKTGIIVINGEVLILSATPILSNQIGYVTVTTTTTNIDADGETYRGARVTRTASLAAAKNTQLECYEIGKFEVMETNLTLSAKIKQMPTTVLNYLSDILAEKLPSLNKSGMTQAQIDAVKTPCLINCTSSIIINNATDYCLTVKKMGAKVLQEQTLADNSKFTRIFDGTKWSVWTNETTNLHLEVKISRGVVFLRHGSLSDDTTILLLRKKKRSIYRRTGGNLSYTKNKGKREKRNPKMQYVHFKGIVLSKGVAGQWYIPKCISVLNQKVDSSLIGQTLGVVCQSLITQKANDTDGNPVYRIQGVRNKIGQTNGKYKQHHGYAQIAIQAARYNNNGGKDQGGEMVKMKYRLCRKKHKIFIGTGLYDWIYYRTFSLE